MIATTCGRLAELRVHGPGNRPRSVHPLRVVVRLRRGGGSAAPRTVAAAMTGWISHCRDWIRNRGITALPADSTESVRRARTTLAHPRRLRARHGLWSVTLVVRPRSVPFRTRVPGDRQAPGEILLNERCAWYPDPHVRRSTTDTFRWRGCATYEDHPSSAWRRGTYCAARALGPGRRRPGATRRR